MKAAYLPWYTRDWRSDAKVALLSWEERSLYRDMIDLSWELGPLPDDPTAVVRAIGAPERLAESVPGIFARFWKKVSGGWRNPRLERERDRTAELIERRRDLGKKGAAARWEKPENAAGNAHGNAYGIAHGIAHGNADGIPDGIAPGIAHGMPRAPEPEPEPSTSDLVLTPVSTPAPSLRSGAGASAPGGGGGLPGIELNPPKGKREPTQAQVDGLTARNVWQRCWQAKFGRSYVGLSGQKSAAVRYAFVRVNRDEAELERLVCSFLAHPPFRCRENPDPIAFLDSLASVAAGLNDKTPDTSNGNRNANGHAKHARRPDGTREGEYAEPNVMPRRA